MYFTTDSYLLRPSKHPRLIIPRAPCRDGSGIRARQHPLSIALIFHLLLSLLLSPESSPTQKPDVNPLPISANRAWNPKTA